MNTITIQKIEYKKLKQYSSAFLRIAEEVTKENLLYPYDYKYIDALTKKALADYKKGKCIEANSIDEALTLFGKK